MEADIHPGLPPAPVRLDPRDDLSVPKREFAPAFRRSAPGEAIRQVGEFEWHARHVEGLPARKPRLLGAEPMAALWLGEPGVAAFAIGQLYPARTESIGEWRCVGV